MPDAAVKSPKEPASTSRYERLVKIASGGMASVYVGRLRGALGFEQLVAIKRPHAHLLETPDLKRMLLTEARLASRIRHANVVGVRDVEAEDDSLLLVMDYVEGASFYELLHRARDTDRTTTIRAGLRVIRDLCAGLQAVHDLTDDDDRPLGLVHRDVSPHNVLVGLDGVARLADFGVAKALHSHDTSTNQGTLKGKFSYMAPEYLQGMGFDQRADIFAVGIMLWELLAHQRLFDGENHVDAVGKLLLKRIPPISEVAPELGYVFDAVVERAIARDPAERFARASEIGAALEAVLADSDYAATHEDVARFVRDQVGSRLAERRQRVKDGMKDGTSGRLPADGAQTPFTAPLAVAVAIADSGVVLSPLRRSKTRVALASAGFGLVIGLGAIMGYHALSAPAGNEQVSPEDPSTRARDDAPAAATDSGILHDAPAPASTLSRPASSANEGSSKDPDKLDKRSRPKRLPLPTSPSAAPPAGPDVPQPRGNPYK